MSSLMSRRQDKSSFTCRNAVKCKKLSYISSKSFARMMSCNLAWNTNHYKHGALRFAWACDATDALELLPAYICGLSQNVHGLVEEFLLCVLQQFWDCSLRNKIESRPKAKNVIIFFHSFTCSIPDYFLYGGFYYVSRI